MDDKDLEILQLLRRGFPLVQNPWKDIGDKLWIDEMSVISRLASLLQRGVVRYLGPFFDSRRLGYHGALMAIDVPPDHIPAATAAINRHAGVTHNYLRDGHPNVWFTLVTRSATEREAVLANIRKQAGVDKIVTAPSRRLFKLRTDLAGAGSGSGIMAGAEQSVEPAELSAADRQLIRVIQDGLKLEMQPFARVARVVGMSPDEVLARLKTWVETGVIRRIGVALHPERLGRNFNALVVWQVPEAAVESFGKHVAELAEVSHAYERETQTDWPYNVYTMIHAADETSLQKIVDAAVEQFSLTRPLVLPTLRELKKTAMRYFDDDGAGSTATV